MRFRLKLCGVAVALTGALESHGQIVNASWTGAGPGTNWSTANNWSIAGLPGVPPSANTTNVFFGAGPGGAYTSTVDSTYTVGNLDIDLGAGAFTLVPSNGATLTVTNQVFDQSANPVAIDIPILGAATLFIGTLGGPVGTFTINSTGNTYSGVTKVDAGTLADGAANAFSPNSVVEIANPGIVNVNFNETVAGLSDDTGANGSLVIASGATLFINGTYFLSFSGVVSGNGGIEMDTGGMLTLSGANTYAGTTVLNAGTTLADGAAGSFSSSSLVSVNAGANLNVNFNEAIGGLQGTGGTVNIASGATLFDAPPSSVAFLGTITGPGSLTIGGFGTVSQTLSGMSTYSGGTTVQSELFVGSSTNGPPGSFTAGPAGTGAITFEFLSQFSPSANVTLANAIVLNDDVQYVDNDDGGNNNLTLTGLITGSSGIAWCTPGILELTGANTFGGGVDMREGTLLLGSSSIGPPDGVTSGPIGVGVLQLDTSSIVAAAIPSVTLGNSITLTGNTQFGAGPADNNALGLTGTISGSGNILYWGGSSGSLTLSGANTFAGTTTIGGGSVFANNDLAFGAGNPVVLQGGGLNVNSGITFGNPISTVGAANVISGSGTITPAITVDNTLTLAPGNPLGSPIGFLTFSNGLTLATNGSLSFKLFDANGAPGTGFGYFSVTGGTLNMTANPGSLAFNVSTIDVNGNPAFAMNFLSSNSYSWMFGSSSSAISGYLAGGAQFNILTGGFLNPTNGGTFSISENAMNQLFLNFTPVPEPSTWILLGSGILSVLSVAMFRRRRASPSHG